MAYFPMFISLEQKPCLVVGGGRVAARKCLGLLEFGAAVTVIARELGDFAVQPELAQTLERSFQPEDLETQPWALVIAATNDRALNHQIADLCHQKRIPVNVADCQQECSFFFPAYCMENNVTAGFSTAGSSPALASALRKRMEKTLPLWIKESREQEKG